MTTSFEQLKIQFDKALSSCNNEEYLLERELRSIEKYVFEKPATEDTFKFAVYNFRSVFQPLEMPNPEFYPFRPTFESLILGEETEELETGLKEYEQQNVEEAKELFRYYQYIQSLLLPKRKPSAKKESAFSHKQKLLALHYLGLNTEGIENSKVAGILSEILELSEDNTRQYLSYISAGKNEVRTKKNLERVRNLFKKKGLEGISQIISADMEK